MRNCAKVGLNVVTKQIYSRSKLMVVDDRFTLPGSAIINNHSLLGERDKSSCQTAV